VSAPRLAQWLLRRVLACDSRDALLGDLAEDHARRRRRDGPLRAYLWYWKQFFASIEPSRRLRAERAAVVPSRRSPSERNAVVDTFVQDLRQALRSLRAAPGFTFGAVATLVLGLGITAVMFTVVYGVLARPLPYADPDALVVVSRAAPDEPDYAGPSSYPAYEFWRDNARAFEELAAYNRYVSFTLRLGDDPESIRAARVSANYFSTLGVAPMMGRDFRPEEDAVDAEPVVILSHELWTSHFGADPDIVGRSIPVGSSSATVVGVMPRDFADISERPRMWITMARETRRGNTNSLYMIGRMRAGVSMSQALADLERVRVQLVQSEPDIHYDAVRASSLHQWIVGDAGRFLRIAGGAVVLVMLIVVANLSNLALVHTTGRASELAVRAAIGASRAQITRLLLIESLLLGLAGALPALVAAGWGVEAFLRMSATPVPRQADIAVDPAVIAFVVAAGVLAAVTAGMLASLVGHRGGLTERLRAGGSRGGVAATNGRTQRSLAVAQLALALALLLSVGLLLRSLVGLQAVDNGFIAGNALLVELSAPADLQPGAERRGFYEELVRRIEALPGVEAAGAVSFMPFSGWSSTGLRIEGMPVPEDPDELPSIEIDAASPGFFAAMGTRITAGRDFAPSDREGAPRVAIINRAMAERYWPDEDPLGHRLFDQDDEEGEVTLTIVGVAENVSARAVGEPIAPKVYTAYAQSDYWWPFGMNVVLRSATPPATLAQPVRDILRDMVTQPPLALFTTLDDWLAEQFADLRFQASLFGIFAVVATLLACVGLYGVIASGVARRTHEIGVRLALGADSRRMLRGVIGSGARLGLLGTLAGVPLALLMTRGMDSMFFGVSSLDPPTLVLTALLLNAVCVAACWLPARRASRVAPLEAMRR